MAIDDTSERVCPSCGTPFRAGAKFCSECAAPLGGSVDRRPEPASPADDLDRALDSVFGWLHRTRTPRRSAPAIEGVWYRQIPGFRSATRWKQVVAVLGYLWIVGFILGLGIYSQPAGALFGLSVLVAIFLGTNAFTFRDRLTDGRRELQGIVWLFLLAVGIWSLIKIPAEPRPQLASAAAVTAGSSGSPAPAAVLTSTPVATPTSLPSPTPNATKAARDKAIVEHLGAANSFRPRTGRQPSRSTRR